MNVFYIVKMVVYVGGINHLYGYFLHRYEACGHVQLFLVMVWERYVCLW